MTKPCKQSGYVLVVLLMVLSMVGASLLFAFFNSAVFVLEQDQKTADSFSHTKEALIGWAVRQGEITGVSRPGEFPCPDTNNDGLAESSCSVGVSGRIPWKTLGIAEPKDSAGETLWYVLAGSFRQLSDNPNLINSDTRGSLKVYAGDGSTVLTNEAVAVIFAPGAALGGQTRDGPNLNVPANYLETVNGINNAATNGPFIVGSRSDRYNDRVFYIVASQFIPIVERRVAKDLKTALQIYFNVNGAFPAASAVDYNDGGGDCVTNLIRGRAPSNCAGTNADLILPNWFIANKWWQVIYYSVAVGCEERNGALGKDKDDGEESKVKDCVGGDYLTVSSNTSIPALFFTPGTPPGTITRPSNKLSDYLDPENSSDHWGGTSDNYVTPRSEAFDRDRIHILSGGKSEYQCANNASMLLANAPCGGLGNTVISQCSTAKDNLQVCPCAEAALTMIAPPCTNMLNPPQCQSAIAALRSCFIGSGGRS